MEAHLTTPALHGPGQSLVSRRAIGQIVRAAVSGSYGVTGFADDGIVPGLLARLHLGPAGVQVRLANGIQVELRILVAAGVPIAEVARQVDSAVRYSVRRAVEREVEQVTIHVGGLRFEPGPMPGSALTPAPVEPGEPAPPDDSGDPADPLAPNNSAGRAEPG